MRGAIPRWRRSHSNATRSFAAETSLTPTERAASRSSGTRPRARCAISDATSSTTPRAGHRDRPFLSITELRGRGRARNRDAHRRERERRALRPRLCANAYAQGRARLRTGEDRWCGALPYAVAPQRRAPHELPAQPARSYRCVTSSRSMRRYATSIRNAGTAAARTHARSRRNDDLPAPDRENVNTQVSAPYSRRKGSRPAIDDDEHRRHLRLPRHAQPHSTQTPERRRCRMIA